MNEQLKQMFDKIQTKKAELLAAETGRYITDGNFRYSTSSEVIHIPSLKHPNKLVEITTFLLGKEKDHESAIKLLELDSTPFTWFGVTVSEWVSDIKLRLTQLNKVAKTKELNELEAKFLKVADPEFVRQMEMEELKRTLESL